MYTPDRTIVQLQGPSAIVRFYRNRGYDDGTVNLNRPNGVMTPTGLFCCEVPNAAEDIQPLCAIIGRIVTDTGMVCAEGAKYRQLCAMVATCNCVVRYTCT
jgi:hypothetical protein